MSKYQISTDILHQVCDTLEKLVDDGFGPNALNSMLCSATGKLLITNSGAAILKAVNVEHPVGQMVTRAILEHHDGTGDGTKTMLFLLSALLRHTEKFVDIAQNDSVYKVIAGLYALKHDVIPNYIVPQILKSCKIVDHIDQAKEQCQKTIHTVLQGKLNVTGIQHFIKILSAVFMDCQTLESIYKTAQYHVDDLDLFCVENPGRPITSSVLLKGLLIQREFACVTSDFFKRPGPVNFLVVSCTLELELETKNVTMKIDGSARQLSAALEYNAWRVRKIATKLQAGGVVLLFMVGAVSRTSLDILKSHGVSVVSHVLEEDAERLCGFTGVLPVHDIDDLLDDGFSPHVAQCMKCVGVVVQQRKGILLQGLSPKFNPQSSSLRNAGQPSALPNPGQPSSPPNPGQSSSHNNPQSRTLCNAGQLSALPNPGQPSSLPNPGQPSSLPNPGQLIVCGPTNGVTSHLKQCVESCLRAILHSFDPDHIMETGSDMASGSGDGSGHVEQNQKSIVTNHQDLKPPDIHTKPATSHSKNTVELSTNGDLFYSGFKDKQYRMYSLPGGGVFELQLSRILDKFISENKFTAKATTIQACESLRDAVLAVPLKLVRNSYASAAHKLSLVHLMKGLKEHEEYLVGVDAKLGNRLKLFGSPEGTKAKGRVNGATEKGESQEEVNASNNTLKEKGHQPSARARDRETVVVIEQENMIVESTPSKILLLYHVLELLSHMLRLDGIVSVNKLPKESDSEDEEKDSDSD